MSIQLIAYTVFALVWLIALPSFAQSVIAEIDVPDRDIEVVQAFSIADSVYVTYVAKGKTKSVDRKSFWIARDGRVTPMPDFAVAESVICGIMDAPDATYYYALVANGAELVLQGTACNRGGCAALDRKFTISGELLGVSVAHDILVLSYDKKYESVRLVRLDNRLQEIGSSQVSLPTPLEAVYKDCSGFMSKNQFLSIAQGASRLKLYRERSEVVLTANLPRPAGKIMIVRIPLSGEAATIKNLTVPGKSTFTSYFHNDRLYTAAHELNRPTLKCFDLKSGNLVMQTVLQGGTSQKNKMVYSRAESGEVAYAQSVNEMLRLANSRLPSLIVDSDSDEFDLIYGNYYNEKGIGYFGGLNPLGMLVSVGVNSVVRQFDDGPGICMQAYLKKTASQFEFIDQSKSNSVRQVIDDFEIASLKEGKHRRIQTKRYVKTSYGAAGVYIDANDNVIRVVSFQKAG